MNCLEILKSSIDVLAGDFRSNPFDYLYEADIQASLFSIAREKFRSSDVSVSMDGGYHSPNIFPRKYAVRTTPVKCEYPSGQRFDIAIIDPLNVEPYDPVKAKECGWKNDRFWGQPVCAAVEIKYMQLGDPVRHRVDGLRADIEKLRSYGVSKSKFCGIAILFVQTAAQYSEIPSPEMNRIAGVNAVEEGIYAAIIGPENMAWYRA